VRQTRDSIHVGSGGEEIVEGLTVAGHDDLAGDSAFTNAVERDRRRRDCRQREAPSDPRLSRGSGSIEAAGCREADDGRPGAQCHKVGLVGAIGHFQIDRDSTNRSRRPHPLVPRRPPENGSAPKPEAASLIFNILTPRRARSLGPWGVTEERFKQHGAVASAWRACLGDERGAQGDFAECHSAGR